MDFSAKHQKPAAGKRNSLMALALGMVFAGSVFLATAAGAAWDTTTVESGALEPGQPDVDILIDGSDVPHIAYYRSSSSPGELGYASNTGSGWVVETPTSAASSTGDEPSLAIDPSTGYPSITYGYLYESIEIHRVSYDGSSWEQEPIYYLTSDLTGTSHAFYDANRGAVAYGSSGSGDACSFYDGTSWGNSEIIDTNAGMEAPSLEYTPAGVPAVGFYDNGNSSLSYASYAAGTSTSPSTWNSETVAGVPADGIDLEFTPDGNPAISFYDNSGYLNYAVSDGSTWNTQQLVYAIGQTTDLEFDGTGQPVICFQNENILGLQRYDGSTWQTDTVFSDSLADAALDFLSDGRAMIVAGNSSGDVLVFTEAATSTANQPPECPQYVSPSSFRVFAPGQSVTLQASAFSDPEGDSHVASHWKIARADRDIFGCSDYPLSFDSGPTGASLTQYTIPAEDLIPGMAYKWIVGYQDSGSSRFSWSQKNNAEPEPNENIFVVGYQETYTYPAIDSGLTADEFQMLSCHHIPDDPGASAVIGDDLAGGYDPGFYRIGPYDCEFNGGDYREYPGFTAHPGGAAWFLARNGLTVDITGVPLTITADVDVHLQYNPDNNNGWNMIGPPNNRNYRWNDVEVVVYEENGLIVFGPQRIGTLDSTNPYIDTRLWEWTNGAYANDTTMMMADDGYWVRAKQKNVNLRFTVGAQASLGNPDVLLAAGMDQIKRAGRGLVSPKAAMADEDSDSPPEPMDAVENDDDGGSSGGGNCFIGALNF